jgi:Zn-dependent protease
MFGGHGVSLPRPARLRHETWPKSDRPDFGWGGETSRHRLVIDLESDRGAVVINFTLSQLLMRLCAVVLVATVQGFAIAAAARALGDKGPQHDGRLSLDPLRHIDLIGGAVALIFAAGWGRWVAVDPRVLRRGRFDLLLVAVAGFVALVLGILALRFARPFLLPWLPDTAAATAFALIQTIIEVGLASALLGLLPLPPLAGGHLLVALAPKLRERLAGRELFLGLIVAALVATGGLAGALDPALRQLMIWVLGEDVGL